jgi:hypothetical protein
VACAVLRGQDGVFPLEHDLAVRVDEQRAERMVALRTRPPCQLDRGEQVALALVPHVSPTIPRGRDTTSLRQPSDCGLVPPQASVALVIEETEIASGRLWLSPKSRKATGTTASSMRSANGCLGWVAVRVAVACFCACRLPGLFGPRFHCEAHIRWTGTSLRSGRRETQALIFRVCGLLGVRRGAA